ncbi:hypothetical protein PR202_gb25658 [Eleusine coracana subsp. coracana]|uniref:Uncharacterized protein n=1 Tax=Eleusine coracana subsp. coracana TaxID=191504 RepID=A0AAV5FM73_ELECO|nr:hypothetical protein PR202_gb25658 [Eleusine coracana subsp. coracana]
MPASLFLRRVRRDLPRGATTVAAGWVLRQACATVAAAAALLPLLLLIVVGEDVVSPWLVPLGALIALLALLLLVYLGAVCAVAVVASAAEPGRRGSTVARAWRLVRGVGARAATVYVAATWAVWIARLALEWVLLPSGAGTSVIVGAAVRWVLDHVVEVFSVDAAAGLYFECRKIKEGEDKAGHVD